MKMPLALEAARLAFYFYGQETKQVFHVWQRPDQDGFFFGIEGICAEVHISGREVDSCDISQFKALMCARLANLEMEIEDARRVLGRSAGRAPSLHVTDRIGELEWRCEVLLREARKYRRQLQAARTGRRTYTKFLGERISIPIMKRAPLGLSFKDCEDAGPLTRYSSVEYRLAEHGLFLQCEMCGAVFDVHHGAEGDRATEMEPLRRHANEVHGK